MLIYIHGTDDYRIRQRANQYISQYREKFGADLEWRKFNLVEKEMGDEFKNFITSSSMFGGYKLAVLEKGGDNISDILEKIDSPQTIIIFLDIFTTNQDKKKTALKPSLKKNILNKAVVEELNSFSDFNSVKKWINEELTKKSNAKIEDKAIHLLFESFGLDTWRLSNEIEKLSLYRSDEIIREEDVLMVCSLKDDVYVFNIFDAFFNRNKKKTIFLFKKALKSGIEAQAIFNLFVDQIRTASYLILNKPEFLSHMHPYKVKMIQGKLKNFSQQNILNIFHILADIDDAIKNGRTDFESAMEYILFSF